MNRIEPSPAPGRRLWRTVLRRPRDLARLAPPLAVEGATPPVPGAGDEDSGYILLDDEVWAIHRDGTISCRRNYVSSLRAPHELAEWDGLERVYDPRILRPTIARAGLRLPGGEWCPAGISDELIRGGEGLRYQTCSFAPLRPGVLLYYEEQHDYFRHPVFGPGLWGEFFLQTHLPCRRRRLTVAVAEPFQVGIEPHHGAPSPVESSVRRYRTYRWDASDVPGVEWAVGVPPPRDFLPWVEFSTFRSWDGLARHYLDAMSSSQKGFASIRRLAADLTRGTRSKREGAAAVYRHTAQKITSGRLPSEIELPKPRPLMSITEDLRGDCKDKSTLLAFLLKFLDIPARVALLVTRSNGSGARLPAPVFDHAVVVANLDGEEVWLDPTAGPYTLGDLPEMDQGAMALILDPRGPRCVTAPEATSWRNVSERRCRGKLDEKGSYEFQASVTVRGRRAAEIRAQLLECSPEEYPRLLEGIEIPSDHCMQATVRDVQVHGVDDFTDDLRYEYTATLEHCASRTGEVWLLRIPWSSTARMPDFLDAETRQVPVLGPSVMDCIERHEIAVPSGVVLYGLPQETALESAWADYRTAIRAGDGRLVGERRLTTKGGAIGAASLQEFRKFWIACTRGDVTTVVMLPRTWNPPGGGSPPSPA